MMKTTIVYRCLRVAMGGSLMAGTVFLFATAACGEVNQCTKGKINSQDCWVGLQVSGNTVSVTPSDVALTSNTKFSWKRTDTPVPPATPGFAVDFDRDDCTPFGGVFHFDQSTPPPAADPLPPSQFERCKYKVTIDNLTVDAQVIVIGGPQHRTKSHRRYFGGEW